jgi:hypothetical protein
MFAQEGTELVVVDAVGFVRMRHPLFQDLRRIAKTSLFVGKQVDGLQKVDL